ncbi:hypothetical protein FRX31_033509 [Thalictrum thalictroides]|uniref:RNase H type-1 domain-containing protein n=1 Tax=Thalictrum thalictroides TaxID=46969 RepID=A0A7J6UWA8_THATH|nr:hypothetical protein FRX31_033509 [Thalictrum thalictroides]
MNDYQYTHFYKTKKLYKTASVSWQPPPNGRFTVNCDGACFGNHGPAEFGGVLRNSYGQVLGWFGLCIGESTNNLAEGYAILHGLKMAFDLNINCLIIETYSRVLIEALHKETQNKKLWTVTQQCKA